MLKLRSLTARMLLYWSLGAMVILLAYPVVIVLPLMASGIGDPLNVKLQGAATKSARLLLLEAARRATDGSKYIEATDALRDYTQRNPKFRYAAFDPDRVEFLPGSSTELVEKFRDQLTRVDVLSSTFRVASELGP